LYWKCFGICNNNCKYINICKRVTFIGNIFNYCFFSAAVQIIVYKAGQKAALNNTTVYYNSATYTPPVNFTMTPGTIMNVTTINAGFTTENKVVTVSDVAGNGYQQITFILSEIQVRIN
jgi:hypothetical protein